MTEVPCPCGEAATFRIRAFVGDASPSNPAWDTALLSCDDCVAATVHRYVAEEQCHLTTSGRPIMRFHIQDLTYRWPEKDVHG